MNHVIGIDGGTEGLRAHVVDLSGRSRGVGKCAYATTYPEPGQAEQVPEDWWHACGVAEIGRASCRERVCLAV